MRGCRALGPTDARRAEVRAAPAVLMSRLVCVQQLSLELQVTRVPWGLAFSGACVLEDLLCAGKPALV